VEADFVGEGSNADEDFRLRFLPVDSRSAVDRPGPTPAGSADHKLFFEKRCNDLPAIAINLTGTCRLDVPTPCHPPAANCPPHPNYPPTPNEVHCMRTKSISRVVSEAILPLCNTHAFDPVLPTETQGCWSARVDLDDHAGLPGAVCLTVSPCADEVVISVLFFPSKVSLPGEVPAQSPAAETIGMEQFKRAGQAAHISRWLDAKLEVCRQRMLAQAS